MFNAQQRYYRSPKGQRWRKRWKEKRRQRYHSDPEWHSRVLILARRNRQKHAKNPAWRAKRNARERIYRAERQKDPIWRQRTAVYHQDSALRRWLKSVGWTQAKYNTMSARGCMICGRKKVRRLVRDHSYKTGKARGLLCDGCNVMLGWFEKRAKAVKEYLKRGTSKKPSARNRNPLPRGGRPAMLSPLRSGAGY